MAGLLSGKTAQRLVAAIQRNFITAGSNIEVASRDEQGTFLRRRFTGNGGGGVPCACPDGLSDTYCTSDPFGGDNPNAMMVMTRVSPCYWCGWTGGAIDERQKRELSWVDDIGTGECGWSLSINEGVVILHKPWEGGNPAGIYTDILNPELGIRHSVTASCTGAGVDRPCATSCPPAEAPTSVNIRIEGQFNFDLCEGTGFAEATINHAEDFDLSDWESEGGCCTKIISDNGTLFTFDVAAVSGNTECCDIGSPFPFVETTVLIRSCPGEGTVRIDVDVHPQGVCDAELSDWGVSEGTDFTEFPTSVVYENMLGGGDFIRVTLTFS